MFTPAVETKIKAVKPVKTVKSELFVVGLASNRVPQDLDGILNLGTVYIASAWHTRSVLRNKQNANPYFLKP